MNALEKKEKYIISYRMSWREREGEGIMLMGMVLTGTHCYVAEFCLSLRPSAGSGPAFVHTLPGSGPGAPPTRHRTQAP